MIRKAIIKSMPFCTYTGTAVCTEFTFLCWDDEKNAKEKVKEKVDEGYDVFEINIPIDKQSDQSKIPLSTTERQGDDA